MAKKIGILMGGGDCPGYRVERVAEAIRARSRAGITFSIICVAEGAHPEGGEHSVAVPVRGGHEKRLGAPPSASPASWSSRSGTRSA